MTLSSQIEGVKKAKLLVIVLEELRDEITDEEYTKAIERLKKTNPFSYIKDPILSDDWQVCDIVYSIATDALLEDDVSISPKVISLKEYYRLQNVENNFIKNVIREGITV